MGPFVTLTPQISKLGIYLGYMQIPSSSKFPIKHACFWFHTMNPERCMLMLNYKCDDRLETTLAKINDNQNKKRL